MENIKRIVMLLLAAIMLVMMPACVLAEDTTGETEVEATAAPAEVTEEETAEAEVTEETAEEETESMNIGQKFLETGKITVLGMLGIFAVMIVIYIVITVLNKTTK